MNASSTRRSESISYVHAVSRMAVDPRGHTDDPGTDEMQTPAACAEKCSREAPGKQQRTYPNVDSTRSCHLGDAGISVRSCLRAGNAADGTRTSRAVRGCAGKAHDHRRRNDIPSLPRSTSTPQPWPSSTRFRRSGRRVPRRSSRPVPRKNSRIGMISWRVKSFLLTPPRR